MATALVIPDLHCPWHHPSAWDFLADLRRKYRPDHVICLGDEIDAHRWMTHPQSPDAPGPTDEIDQARTAIRRLFKLFKSVKVCHSNHTLRIYRRASEAGLPGDFLRGIGDILDAPPGWQWSHWWDVDGIHYRHGDGFTGAGGALKAAKELRRSTVIGHIHSHAGIHYHAGLFDVVWGMNAGCLVDPAALVFQYGRYGTQRVVLGAGIVVDGKPIFEPLRS